MEATELREGGLDLGATLAERGEDVSIETHHLGDVAGVVFGDEYDAESAHQLPTKFCLRQRGSGGRLAVQDRRVDGAVYPVLAANRVQDDVVNMQGRVVGSGGGVHVGRHREPVALHHADTAVLSDAGAGRVDVEMVDVGLVGVLSRGDHLGAESVGAQQPEQRDALGERESGVIAEAGRGRLAALQERGKFGALDDPLRRATADGGDAAGFDVLAVAGV